MSPSAARILPGGVTHDSARLRVEGWPGPSPPVTLAPATPGVVIETRLAGEFDPSSPVHIVDLRRLSSDTVYTVSAGGAPATIRTAPATLVGSAGLLLALTSCYFPSATFVKNPPLIARALANRDVRPPGPAGAAKPLAELRLPHATFLCGDQIYADLGHGFSFGRHVYSQAYAKSWHPENLGDLLRLGGNYFAPDDHEYWNGFPEGMFYLRATSKGRWQETARAAATEVWRQQALWNFAPGVEGGSKSWVGWCHGLLGDVGFFVSDLRSDRTSRDSKRRPENLRLPPVPPLPPSAKDASLLGREQREALLAWLLDPWQLGILVLSQPLLTTGSRSDSALDDFADHRRALASGLCQAVLAGKSIVLLSGDIHWGRLTTWSPENGGPGRLVELVSSPVARINPGIGAVGNLFNEDSSVGKRREVPPPGELARDEHTKSANQLLAGLRRSFYFATSGNQFGLVDLWQTAGRRPRGRFEIFDLNSENLEGRPRLARNDWSPTRSCTQELDL